LKFAARFWLSILLIAMPVLPQMTNALPNDQTPVQHFVCNVGYTLEKCRLDIAILKRTVAKYPMAELGDWTWVLVRSENWKTILRTRGLDPDSPAFTFYPKRETFIEEALVTQVPVRDRELLLKWSMDRMGLLDLAIRHELGHALCNDLNERNADRVAKLLEQRKPVSCEAKAEAKQKSGHHASLN